MQPDVAVPDPRAVMAAFGLSGSVRSCAEIGGGWSNRVLRLSTTDGDYAVKLLRNAWGEPRWLDWLDEGWRLERAVIAAGVAAPEPVPVPATGHCLAWVEATASAVPVRVHRWVESRTVPREPVDLELAAWVGRTLAAVHALSLQPLQPSLYAGRTGLTTADDWPDLVARSRDAGAPWSEALDAAEPLARKASALLVDDGGPTVLSHGDVDQKNLLLGTDGPLLCDWDVVLPTVASHDVAHAALAMASWRQPLVAAAVLRGYSDARGSRRADIAPTDLGPALASRVGWIRFSVDRALGAGPEASTSGDSPDIAALLADLAHRVRIAESLDSWLDGEWSAPWRPDPSASVRT